MGGGGLTVFLLYFITFAQTIIITNNHNKNKYNMGMVTATACANYIVLWTQTRTGNMYKLLGNQVI